MEEDNLVPGIGGEILNVRIGETPQRYNTDNENDIVIHAGATAIANIEHLFQQEVRGALTDTRNYIPDSEAPRYATENDLIEWIDRRFERMEIINLPRRNGRDEQEAEIQRLREAARESGLLPIDAEEPQVITQLEDNPYRWYDRLSIPRPVKNELVDFINEMHEQNDIPLQVRDKILDKINTY